MTSDCKHLKKYQIKPGEVRNPKGRPPGLRDRTYQAKLGFFEAFKRLGGIDEVVKWAKKNDDNYHLFLKIFMGMLPRNDKLKINDAKGINIKIIMGDESDSKNIMEIHSDSRDASAILAHNSAS